MLIVGSLGEIVHWWCGDGEDGIVCVNGDLAGDGDGDGIARSCIDHGWFALMIVDDDLGVEGGVDDFGDGDGFDRGAELIDGIDDEVVGHWSADIDAGEPAVNGDCFGDADDDWE